MAAKKNHVEEALRKLPPKKVEEVKRLILEAVKVLGEVEETENSSKKKNSGRLPDSLEALLTRMPPRRARELKELINKIQKSLKSLSRKSPSLTLDMLLDGITEDNIHPETDTGVPVGNEVW